MVLIWKGYFENVKKLAILNKTRKSKQSNDNKPCITFQLVSL